MTAPAVVARPRLPAQQRAVFDALAAREGTAVPYTDLNLAIGLSPYADRLHLKVLVCRLRKAMSGKVAEIQAVPNKGYRFYRAPGVTFPWEGA